MVVERTWNGEDLTITLTQDEAMILRSFLGFFSRERVGGVTDEEYDVATSLYSQISSYADDELEVGVVVDKFNKLFK